MRRLATTVLGGLMLAGTAQAEVAGDAENGRKLSGQCRTCHGANGYAQVPIAPHIGGEPASYLAAQLTAFREGTREHEMMTVVAKMLTDDQIADLAAWYSSQTATATLTADPSGAPEQCVACHGVDGIAVIENAPNLAGETNIYIDTQLKAFKRGKRTHEIMSAIAADMTDEEIRAAADWYSEVQLEITEPGS
ncbi:c-type cytochrome [Litorisediminicola beolgyonensis]|uniref:C-type cytochrome n=1 Tax=Litorisediminicola beolgyonensis TaxID=1173614 RepID=A0ABW3ZI55_9RHOB